MALNFLSASTSWAADTWWNDIGCLMANEPGVFRNENVSSSAYESTSCLVLAFLSKWNTHTWNKFCLKPTDHFECYKLYFWLSKPALRPLGKSAELNIIHMAHHSNLMGFFFLLKASILFRLLCQIVLHGSSHAPAARIMPWRPPAFYRWTSRGRWSSSGHCVTKASFVGPHNRTRRLVRASWVVFFGLSGWWETETTEASHCLNLIGRDQELTRFPIRVAQSPTNCSSQTPQPRWTSAEPLLHLNGCCWRTWLSFPSPLHLIHRGVSPPAPLTAHRLSNCITTCKRETGSGLGLEINK